VLLFKSLIIFKKCCKVIFEMIKKGCFCFSWLLICFFLQKHALYAHPDFKSIGTRLLQIEDDSLKVKILLDSSNRFLTHDPIKSLEFAKMADDISINSKDTELRKLTSLQLGMLFFYKGSYENAIDYYAQLLKISEQDKDYEWIGKAYFQLGGVRLVMEDYGIAENHFNKAKSNLLKVYQNEDQIPLNLRINFCNNLGIIYSGRQEFDKAEEQFEKGIELAKGHEDYNPSLIRLLNNMGDVMSKKKQLGKAALFYEEAMNYIKISPNPLMESMLFNSLGKLQLQHKDYELARQYFLKGYSLAQAFQGFSHLKHLADNLSTTYTALGKSDSALVYLQLSISYTDSLDLKNSAEKILQQELLSKYDLEKFTMGIINIKNKLVLALVFVGFLLLLAFYLIRYFQFKRSLDQIIEMKVESDINREKIYESNKKLAVEINEKNKILAVRAMSNIQKDIVLDQLTKAVNGDLGPKLVLEEKEKMNELISKLQQVKGSKVLDEFEFRFTNIYSGFFEKLLKENPDLTLNERRLAAFLKLQLTTKEIASITGQSVRAIEIARTRIRKKLRLTKSDKSLYDYFIDY
jgi:tetratricopeptide (TPR) repeat protein